VKFLGYGHKDRAILLACSGVGLTTREITHNTTSWDTAFSWEKREIMKKLTLTLTAISGFLVISSEAGAWQSNINGTVNGDNRALAVTVDDASNAIAAGFIRNSGTGVDDFTIVKSSGVDRTELWRQVINGTANGDDRALALGIDVAGAVMAAGRTNNSDTFDDFIVVKLRGTDGGDLSSSPVLK
jgi:hypothetical protein